MRPRLRHTVSGIAAGIYIFAAAAGQAQSSDWGKGGVCYEIFVRSFFDSDGDGIGDINGLTRKLDYVSGLGVNCIWLMPIAQSPSYHGYDVTNYYEVNRDYGTNADFKRFMTEAHRRGIRVLVDLVLNHSSSEHPYFQSALMDSSSPYRDWYLWGKEQKKARGWDAPVWHRNPFRDEYYYGLFWSGMPDLNLSNPEVKAEARKIARFWLKDMNVDGFRLDAVAHFIEAPDTVMNASGNNPWLREYSAEIKKIKPTSFTVGEVTYDTPDIILKYYPDQLDSYFTFQIANLLIDAVRSGSAARLMPALEYSQKTFPAGRWSPFLRNHDQTRTMTELDGDFAKAKVAAALLLTLPGFPFVYYGEEIGMTGSKPDPRLRTPMNWRRAPAAGFTTGMAWEPLQPDSMTANVEAQDRDQSSLLNNYRKLINLRASNPAIGSGDFVSLATGNNAVAAYLRRKGNRNVIVLANLGTSRASGIALRSEKSALPAGTYSARSLFGGGGNTTFRVDSSGSISAWIPVQSLDALSVHIFEVDKCRSGVTAPSARSCS